MNTWRDRIVPLPLQAKRTTGAAAGADNATRAACPAGDLFAQALRDDSNLELDWLWAAAQLTDAVQRRYCLKRALAINPKSELARYLLNQARA
jgi:hypothetical protein